MSTQAPEANPDAPSEAQAPVPGPGPVHPGESLLVIRFLDRGKILSFERRSANGVEWISGAQTETLVNLLILAAMSGCGAFCLLSFVYNARR